jgi:molecular chaperone Hsp33
VAERLAAAGGELRRFMLERLPVRGFWIRLDVPWRELRRHQHYAPSVEALLGEAVSASVLLAATLKFHGTLTLQLAGDGLVSLLVAQCTHDFSIRAVARAPEIVVGEPGFRQLVGDGRLSVTVEADERAARYQGIVALEGRTLADCIETYCATSEQLPTRIALAADSRRSAGLLLQNLPQTSAPGQSAGVLPREVWDSLSSRVAALDGPLLRLSSAEDVLQRVCAEHDCRLYAGAPVKFICRCDAARVRSVLRSLGVEELRGILDEQGAVSVTCEFCGRPYQFDAIDVERLFAIGAGPGPESPQSLN